MSSSQAPYNEATLTYEKIKMVAYVKVVWRGAQKMILKKDIVEAGHVASMSALFFIRKVQ